MEIKELFVNKKNYIGALDIGSQHITFLLGEISNQRLNLVGHSRVLSKGIQKAQIEDLKQLNQVLGDFFESLSRKFSGLPDMLCLSQSGAHLRCLQYETHLPLNGFQHIITEQDLKQLNLLAGQKTIPQEYVFLHSFRQFYTVDGLPTEHPLGHVCKKLSVFYNAIFGKTQPIKDQLYAVNQFGFRVKHLVFSGIASALATTHTVERENGVCVINLGDQITEFIVYKNQIPVLMGTVPVGGKNFTNDLSSGLQIHPEDAERLKIEHGIPFSESNLDEKDIWILGNHSIGDKKVKVKNFRIIFHARAQELFDYIYRFIKKENLDQSLLSGIVLTGGGALLKNIEKVAAQSFNCDCFVRGPIANVDGDLKSPLYSTCFGLLHYALQQTAVKEKDRPFLKKIADWFGKK